MVATTTSDFGAALTAAIQGGYVAQLSGGTYTITQPIVIYVNQTETGPIGIDGGGATLISQVTNGSPLITIVVGPGVDFRYLQLSNFNIQGNGQEGDGIKLVADGNDRWLYNWTLSNVTVQHVGGYGLDVQGSVFEGLVSNSWMNNNAAGGAYFTHADGGQVSAMHWFGGGFEGNGGAGLTLDNGARDMNVDGVTFQNNGGPGISAMWGITSVSDSTFTNNHGPGVQFENYGNFNDDTFSTTGAQTIGINGSVAGGSTLIDDTSTGAPLANLQGTGGVFETGDSGSTTIGSSLAVAGMGGGDLAHVTVGTQGVALPTLAPVTMATTAAVANTTGTGAVETALKSAFASGTVEHLTAASYTVTAPIVINITASSTGPVGIDLGGARIDSQITNGAPVIEIIVGPGVNVGQLTLSNFTITGNTQEGDGIKIVADGTDRTISNLNLNNVNIENVGGIGLDVIGNVSHGTIFDSWMNGDLQGGARFANSPAGGVATGLNWEGGGFRKNGVAGLILANGAHDMTVKGAYFVENVGPGIDATSGLTLVQESGFENNGGTGAVVQGPANFTDDGFSTWGVQTTGIGGSLNGGQITLTGVGAEYYGAGADPTVLANIQGKGTLAVAAGGNIVAGPGVSVTGGNPVVNTAIDTTAPVTTSTPVLTERLASDTGSSASDLITSNPALAGTADANAVVHFTVDGKAVTQTATANASGAWSFTPTGLNDGTHTVVASETTSAGATGSASLTFQLDTTAPVVTETQVGGGSSTQALTLIGTGAANATVHFVVDGSAIAGTAAANSAGAWSFTPPTLANGQHTIVATETDVAGNVGSASLAITVGGTTGGTTTGGTTTGGASGTKPPAITEVLANDTGASASDNITSNPALKGTAAAGATIHFAVDGAAVAATATANSTGAWSYTPTGLSDGTHTIVASETNASGTGSASLTFTLETHAPVTTLTGATLANGQAIITGTTGEASDSVQIYGDNGWLGAATTKSDGTFSFTDPNPSHSYGAFAVDLAGNIGTVSNHVTPGTSVSTPPPSASSSPTSGAPTVSEVLANDTGASTSDHITSNPALKGTADPGATVHFSVDGTAIAGTGTANSTGAWSYTPTGLADGTHTIVASETNASGTGSASLTFTLDTHAPVTTLTGATLANGQAIITGTTGEASDSVQIYGDNGWLGAATTKSDGSFSFTDPNPSHSYGAFAVDLAGNIGTVSNHVTPGTSVSTPPPSASSSPTSGAPAVSEALANDTGASASDHVTWSPALKGTADPGATVHFTVDGAAVAGTATADGTGAWSYTPAGLSDGSHTVVASEINASGTGSASLTFALETHAPISVFQGASLANGQATLTGSTGEAGDTISVYDGSTWLGMTTTGASGNWTYTAPAAAGQVHNFGVDATDLAGLDGYQGGRVIIGGLGADMLTGTSASDIIMGTGGNNRIVGGAGADTLTGGSGQVTFAFNAVSDSTPAAADTITDFRAGVDRLDFTNIAGINASNGVAAFQGNITGSGNLTLNAHSVAYLEVGSTTQVLVNTSNAAETVTTSDMHAADMKVSLLGVHLGLTATDFHHA